MAANPLSTFLAWSLCGALRLYRFLATPVKYFFGVSGCCRYTPSCSRYFEEAVRLHGPVCGCGLGVARLLRCHPWAPFGPDPVPPAPVRRCVRAGASLS